MANIGQMVAKLLLDSQDFTKKLSEAEASLGSFENKSTNVGGKVAGGIAKTIGGIGVAGLGAFAGTATIATAALTAVGVGLGNMASNAAALPAIEGAFNGVAASFEGGGAAMLKALQEGSSGMITNTELMRSYNTAAQLVGTEFANNLPQAMGYLSKVSAATGQDMGFMMDSLVKGVGRMSPMILDNLGIQVSLEEATARAAETFGKEADELSKAELQAGMMSVVLEKLEENTAAMPDVAENAATKLAQFKTTMSNLKDEIGVAFLPTLTNLVGVVGDFATAALPAVIPMVELFGTVISNLMTALTPILGLLSGFAGGLGKVAEAFGRGELTGASVFLTKSIKDLADGLAESLPAMLETGTNLVMSLVQGISNSIPTLMPVMMTINSTILDSLVTNLPEMFTIGIGMITNIIDGIAAALPEILAKGAEIVMGLVSAIIASIPSLITSGIGMIQAVIDGLLAMIPILIEHGPDLVIQFLEAVLSSATQLLASGAEMITQIINGIVSMIPMLVEKGPEFVTELITAIVTLLPELLVTGVDLIVALINGIVSALPQLIAQAPVLIAALVTALIGALPSIINAGVEMITALVEGITSMITNVIAVAPDIIKGFVDGIKAGIGEMVSAGAALMNGLKDGIVGAVAGVIASVKSAVGGIISSVKGAFGIHSPSKVFYGFGLNIGEGLEIGIIKSVGDANLALQKEMKDVGFNFSNFDKMTPEYKQNIYNLTMPTTANAGDVRMAFELMEAWA